MAQPHFIDTTLRDGHQCLWATRMTTDMMLPILESMDRIGLDALEIMGAVHFDACVRFLREDPWARLRLLRDGILRTDRQAIIRSKCALRFELEPDDISRLWVERLIANGIDRVIGFDGLHDLDNLVDSLRHAKALGAHTGGWLIFSESPVHTDAFYGAKAADFVALAGVDELVIEDTSGILTPERVRSLVPAIRKSIGALPLGLHTHNLVGLAQRTYLEAARQGVDRLYCCIAPLADGNAPPALQTTLRNLRHVGHQDGLDDNQISAVAGYLTDLAAREGKPVGSPRDFDAANFDHQIPGGVLSNLAAQLEAAGLGERLGAVLVECGRVREELGWPIMVTPFSQFVGVQATLNILGGDRYGRVPNEVKRFALGHYGRLNAPVDADVLDRIVERGAQSIPLEPPSPAPALPALREAFPDADDEELLLRHSFPQIEIDAMYAAVAAGAGAGEDASIARVVRNVVENGSDRSVEVKKPGLRVTLRRRGERTD